MMFLLGTNVFGLAFFSISTINQLGFGAIKSQLLSVGPFAVSFFGKYSRIRACVITVLKAFLRAVTLISAYLSDKHQVRAIPAVILGIIAAIGYALFLG